MGRYFSKNTVLTLTQSDPWESRLAKWLFYETAPLAAGEPGGDSLSAITAGEAITFTAVPQPRAQHPCKAAQKARSFLLRISGDSICDHGARRAACRTDSMACCECIVLASRPGVHMQASKARPAEFGGDRMRRAWPLLPIRSILPCTTPPKKDRRRCSRSRGRAPPGRRQSESHYKIHANIGPRTVSSWLPYYTFSGFMQGLCVSLCHMKTERIAIEFNLVKSAPFLVSFL